MSIEPAKQIVQRVEQLAVEHPDLQETFVSLARDLEALGGMMAMGPGSVIRDVYVQALQAERDRLKDSLAACQARLTVYQEQARASHDASVTDFLTGLLNRRGWESMMVDLDKDPSQQRDMAIIYMDLNNLRVINNTQGHRAGDELITRAAGVIAQFTRNGDYSARLGGDEFVLLAQKCGDDRALEYLKTRLRAAFETAGVSMSIGGALVDGMAGSLSTAFDEADKLMYEDKAATRPMEY